MLLNCNSKQTQSHTSIEDGTVSLCTDMYMDDYREQSYLDVHVSWIDRQFQKQHAALAVRHFGHRGSYWRLQPKLSTVSLRSTVFRDVGWVWLGQQIWTHVHLWFNGSVYNHELLSVYVGSLLFSRRLKKKKHPYVVYVFGKAAAATVAKKVKA